MSTTAIIILNVVLMVGIVAAIVTLCAGAILTSPEQERRHRQARRHRTAPARRPATNRAFVHPSYEA